MFVYAFFSSPFSLLRPDSYIFFLALVLVLFGWLVGILFDLGVHELVHFSLRYLLYFYLGAYHGNLTAVFSSASASAFHCSVSVGAESAVWDHYLDSVE